ncbi:MAG: GNAT family N-acetyltransferase [Pseudomonadota bacterium]
MAITAAEIIKAERMVLGCWRAPKIVTKGNWLLCIADGLTGRANSLFILDPYDVADFKERLNWMEETYRSEGLVPTVRLSPLVPRDVMEEVKKRGYKVQKPSVALKRSLNIDAVTADVAQDATMTVDMMEHLSDEWLETLVRFTPRFEGQAALVKQMLVGVKGDTAYFAMRKNGETIALIMAIKDGDCLTVQNLVTQEEHRRSGLAERLMDHALKWGVKVDCTWCWLAVDGANTPALKLYDKLGFDDFYQYAYASKPDTPQ